MRLLCGQTGTSFSRSILIILVASKCHFSAKLLTGNFDNLIAVIKPTSFHSPITCKLYFPGQWKQSCDELMRIEAPKSKKPSALQRGSLFHEIGNDEQSDTCTSSLC